jgi:hypothetical protein
LRKLLLSVSLIAALSVACENSTPVGPGAATAGPGTVVVTQTTSSTTSTSTIASTTSTVAPVLTASFVVSPTAAKTGEQVMVNASASNAAPGRRIVLYAWDYGDGVKKEGVTSSHDYDNAGTFAIILTISDDAGQQATTTRMVTITAAPPPASGQAQFVVLQTPPPTPDVPADLTLLFQLLTSGSTSFLSRTTVLRPMADATYNIAPGSSYTRGDKSGGIIKGQFVGTLTPLNGKFSGSLTHASGTNCVTERVFTGVVGDFLDWTGGAIVVPDCSGGVAWSYPKFTMVKK